MKHLKSRIWYSVRLKCTSILLFTQEFAVIFSFFLERAKVYIYISVACLCYIAMLDLFPRCFLRVGCTEGERRFFDCNAETLWKLEKFLQCDTKERQELKLLLEVLQFAPLKTCWPGRKSRLLSLILQTGPECLPSIFQSSIM